MAAELTLIAGHKPGGTPRTWVRSQTEYIVQGWLDDVATAGMDAASILSTAKRVMARKRRIQDDSPPFHVTYFAPEIRKTIAKTTARWGPS